MAATKVASLVVAAVGIWLGPSYRGVARDVAGGVLSSWTGGRTEAPAEPLRSALRDEEPVEDDVGEAEPLDICLVLPVARSPARRRLVEMAYSDDYSLPGVAAYLLAAHAWWCWRCCGSRDPAPRRYHGRAVVSSRASPSW